MGALANALQVQWPAVTCNNGDQIRVRMNRPGTTTFTVAAADTLVMDLDYVGNPCIVGELTLSQKYQTQSGSEAFDAVQFEMRDRLSYTGTVNGTPVTEDFTGSYQTVLGVWFNQKGTIFKPDPYWCWIQYITASGTEIVFCGTYDALQKVQSYQWAMNRNTSTELLIKGSRSIQIVSIESQLNTVLWRDVLALIGHDDCAQGDFYNWFMYNGYDTDLIGYTNSKRDIWSTTNAGPYYQAVPFMQVRPEQNGSTTRSVNAYGFDGRAQWDQFSDGSHSAKYYNLDNNKPWPSQRGFTNWTNNPIYVATVATGFGGSGYAVNDTFSISGGDILAVGKVTAVSGGAVTAFTLNSTGSGYTPSQYDTDNYGTTTLTGSGSGLQVNIARVLQSWGPWGTWGIQILTLIQKMCSAMNFSSFSSSDLVTAINFYPQIADTTNETFPIGIDATEGLGPIGAADQWVCLNALAGAHPVTGEQMLTDFSLNPTEPVLTLLNGICTFWGLEYLVSIDQTTGAPKLALQKAGTSSGSLPTTWKAGDMMREEPATIGVVQVAVHNRADSLNIIAPRLQSGQQTRGTALGLESPWRLMQASWTLGNRPNPWDNSDKDPFTTGIFQMTRFDWGDYGAGSGATLNPDYWKGLAGVYFQMNSLAVAQLFYPASTGAHWTAFDGTNVTASPNGDGYGSGDYTKGAFMVLSAEYPAGVTYPNGRNFYPNEQNGERFNSRALQAVTFASYRVPQPTTLRRTYLGIKDDGGNIRTLSRGLEGSFMYDGSVRTFRALELMRKLRAGASEIVWLEKTVASTPDLDSMPFGPANGQGGTSTSGTSTADNGGGGGGSNFISLPWQPSAIVEITGTGVVAILNTDSAILATANTITGVTAPTVQAPNTLVITNKTGADWTAGDFYIANNDTWLLYYDGTATKSDPTLKAGWNLMGRSS